MIQQPVKKTLSVKILTAGIIAIISGLLVMFLYISISSSGNLTRQIKITTHKPSDIIRKVKDADANIEKMSIYASSLSSIHGQSYTTYINVTLKKLYLETEQTYERLKDLYSGPEDDIRFFKSSLDRIKAAHDQLIVFAADPSHTKDQIEHIIQAVNEPEYSDFLKASDTILNYEQTQLDLIFEHSNHIYRITVVFSSILALGVLASVILYIISQARLTAELRSARDSLNDALIKTKRADSAKSDFLARMSHDIRTPLNGIIGMNYIAQNNLDNKKVLIDALEKTRTSAEYLLGLLNDILDMSKIESGKMKLTSVPFDLRKTIESIEQMEKPVAAQKKQQLIITFPDPSVSLMITGDELRLSQIIVNLVSNALKFTPDKGTISLTIQAESREDHRILIHFIVADTGIGMSDDMLSRLYHPFEQENSITASVYGGSGLGLTIVHTLVTLMKGTIDVKSRKNTGTVFTVNIEFSVPQETAGIVDKSRVPVPSSYTNVKVLIIEDNPINLQILSEILLMHGIHSDTAANGQEGLDIFLKNKAGTYQMIFSDIKMPVMDGYECVHRIRLSSHPDAQTIPIIAMSANAYHEDIQASIEAGMNEHLSKPVNVDQLLIIISKFLSQNTPGENREQHA